MKKCMSGCGGKMMSKGGPKVTKIKKMAAGGVSGKMIPLSDNNPRVYSGRMAKNGGTAKKFAALAPPYDKATYADKIAGAKKKAKFGASVPVQHSPAPGRVRSSSGVGTVPVGARKKMGGSTKRK